MIFMVGSLIFLIGSTLLMKRTGVKGAISKGIALAVILSLLANISLAENVATNYNPELHDGYSISRGIASWILGDDGGVLQGFQKAYSASINFTLFLLMFYVIVVIVETKMQK